MGTDRDIVERFNQAINDRDLDAVSALLHDDYVFVDTAGNTEHGKDAGIRSWEGFFRQFPDYRNVFEEAVERDDSVVVRGHSECSEPALEGPALWVATIQDGLIKEWRVLEDTPSTRSSVGL